MRAKSHLPSAAMPGGVGQRRARNRKAADTAPGTRPTRALDRIDVLLVRRLQHDFPLSERPYLELAQQFALTERSIIAHLRRLQSDGVLSRVGPRIAASGPRPVTLLAALQVPQERFSAIAAQINAMDEVVHSSQREHALNLWFVLACATPAALAASCRQIEHTSGLALLTFPSEKDFSIDWKLQSAGV